MLKPNFEKLNGLLPAIIQDYESKKVLMLGFMNEEAFDLTMKTGKVHYYSRTRDKLWLKGESSGHFQEIKEIYFDCDEDTLLILANQVGGAACHMGYQSCFYRKVNKDELEICDERVFDPKDVYK